MTCSRARASALADDGPLDVLGGVGHVAGGRGPAARAHIQGGPQDQGEQGRRDPARRAVPRPAARQQRAGGVPAGLGQGRDEAEDADQPPPVGDVTVSPLMSLFAASRLDTADAA